MQTDHLIGLYLTQQASKEQKEEVEKWITASDENSRTFNRLKEAWELQSNEKFFVNENEVRDRVWNRLHKGQSTSNNPFISMELIYKAAAVLFILITFSFLVYQGVESTNTKRDDLVKELIMKSNPAGSKSTVQLPDGTMVHLNSNSKITYLKGFDDSVRLIQLTGEAFFDVAHNPEKPFLVEAKGVITKALGTSFDVNAYDDESDVRISLVQGSVWVGNNEAADKTGIILTPGEFASFKNQEFIERGSFDSLSTVGWKDGVLVFDKADFKTVIRKLERWYGLTFIYEGDEPEWSFEGVFRNAYLESILDVLKHSEKIEYTFVKDTVKLQINEKN